MVGERGFQTDFSSSSKALILLRSEWACVTVLETIAKAEKGAGEPTWTCGGGERVKPGAR